MPLIVDDAQLLRMAAEPPRHVARLLARARTFSPLLLLMVVVLPVLAATCATFDVETAVWGLKGLAVLRAETLEQLLIPGVGVRNDASLFEPPLLAWLDALVIPWFPSGAVAGLLAVSACSLSIGTWLTSLWIRGTAGRPLGLVVTVLLITHSQWLLLATTGGADALTIGLLAITGWGLWGHWRLSSTLVSVRLLCAGLAWGCALLAGGILAVAFLAVVGLWMLWLPAPIREEGESSAASPPAPTKTARWWSLAIVFATGAAVGGWWFALMLEHYGWSFAWVWFSQGGNYGVFSKRAVWGDWQLELVPWVQRAAFLSGLWVFGLWWSLRCLFRRGRAEVDQLMVFMALWFLSGALCRVLPLAWPGQQLLSLRHWESFCVIPATVLAAQGLMLMIRRQVSTPTILSGLSLTVGTAVWYFTQNWRVGLVVGGSVGALLAASAPLAIGLRRTSLAWSEPEVRRWIQGYAAAVFLGHALMGADLWWKPPSERAVYESCRVRLLPLSPPDHLSLVVSDSADEAAQLEYLLRSLFPESRWSRAVGWDSELTKIIVAESRQPASRMLVVEWSEKELRLRADIGTGWQVATVVEPIPFLGRRFAGSLIEPVAAAN